MCGSTRVESELLPQMWEQISHKYYERRLLVAEACGVLAPYTPVSQLPLIFYMTCNNARQSKGKHSKQSANFKEKIWI